MTNYSNQFAAPVQGQAEGIKNLNTKVFRAMHPVLALCFFFAHDALSMYCLDCYSEQCSVD